MEPRLYSGAISRFIRPAEATRFTDRSESGIWRAGVDQRSITLPRQISPHRYKVRRGILFKNGKFYENWEHKCLRDSSRICMICEQLRARSIFLKKLVGFAQDVLKL